jgi:tyramine---L-glutamate ligase
MRVFVLEYMVAFWSDARGELGPAAHSLLAEGAAMAAAVASDFEAAGHPVIGFRDAALSELPPPLDRFRAFSGLEETRKLAHALGQADYTLLIVPESRGALYQLARVTKTAGGTLLGPSPEFVGWASDKHATATTLRTAGVPAPRGVRLQADDAWPADFPTPAVLKPIDGCGSHEVRRIDDFGADARTVLPRQLRPAARESAWRLEEFVPGTAASVAVLRGSDRFHLLSPCAQHLSDDGTFHYRGGSCPLEPALAERARALANRAVHAMPPGRGYIGIDLVLGAAADGSQDLVIEVNPRLTTSYVGLRALAETNLAAAMLDVVAGRTPNLAFRSGRVDFTADGQVSLS